MTVHHTVSDVMLWQACREPHQRGFTLIELIMVIVLLGVLAVYAAPRIFDSNDFNARGFHDETLSLLRYAQKTAIAQRRTVCVTFTASPTASARLSIALAEGPSPCDAALIGPNKNCTDGTPAGSKGCITAKPGISYSTGPASLNFDGLGQPVDSAGVPLTIIAPIQVTNAAKAITVEKDTGYVHD